MGSQIPAVFVEMGFTTSDGWVCRKAIRIFENFCESLSASGHYDSGNGYQYQRISPALPARPSALWQ